MVNTWDGNSETDTPVQSEIGNLICIRDLFRSKALAILKLFLQKDMFSFTRAQRVLCYHLIQVPWIIPPLLFMKYCSTIYLSITFSQSFNLFQGKLITFKKNYIYYIYVEGLCLKIFNYCYKGWFNFAAIKLRGDIV